LSSNFINNLRELEGNVPQPSQHDAHVMAHQTVSKYTVDMKGKIVLDLTKDPDPWGYHGMSLSYRLQVMGWL